MSIKKGKFGRCRVQGHGEHCEVTKEIQSSEVPRTTEKAKFMKDAMTEIYENIENLGPEYSKILHDNLWDLHDRSTEQVKQTD